MAGNFYEPVSQNADTEDNRRGISRTETTDVPDEVILMRPPVYYNDGPFSPPSSLDESEEHLLGKDHDHFSSAERGYSEDRSSGIQLGRASGSVLKVARK